MTHNKSLGIQYPIYIVSKGRAKSRLTAKLFDSYHIDYKLVIEPQEYEEYAKYTDPEKLLRLPFSNLGLGSYPARNFCWQHSKKLKATHHWIFDDNIRAFRRLEKGKRYMVAPIISFQVAEELNRRYVNIGLLAFNATYLQTGNYPKPFVLNSHAYSAILICNNLPYRWRLKYNEDVDLCLQVLNSNKYCTILLKNYLIDKVSTVAKMEGGNQTDLYLNNSNGKKIIKARSLEEIWPNYVKTVFKYNRPHHSVNWQQFKTALVRNPKLDWESIKKKKWSIKLVNLP